MNAVRVEYLPQASDALTPMTPRMVSNLPIKYTMHAVGVVVHPGDINTMHGAPQAHTTPWPNRPFGKQYRG